jgi:diguanylate cyclase (GGDEF)-like protein
MTPEIRNLIAATSLITRDGRPEARWVAHVLRLLADALAADASLLAVPTGPRWEILTLGPRPERAIERVTRSGPPRGLLARTLAGETAPLALTDPEPEWDRIPGAAPRTLCGTRVALDDQTVGVLAVWNSEAAAAPLVLAATGAALGAAFANRALVRQLEAEVVTDDLTGVYNYRYLRIALHREVQRAARLGHPLALLMLDVDHLKEYNDRFGHLAGSSVLKQIAAVLRTTVREIDLVAKYGGDEFLLILPHTRRDGAGAAAERLRRAVEATAFPGIASGEMTCSIGISTFPDHGVTAEALLAAADEALFSAKRSGRNRVAVAPSALAA